MELLDVVKGTNIHKEIELDIKRNACINSLETYFNFMGIGYASKCFINSKESLDFIKEIGLDIDTESFIILDLKQLSQSCRFTIDELICILTRYCTCAKVTGYLAHTCFLIYFM